MYSKKRTDIITFLLTWLLTYGLVKGEASEPTVTAVPPKPASPRPTPRIVADPCSLVYQFAKDEAAFSTCAIVSGNNMCKTCVTQILMLTKSFTKLMGEDSFKRMNDSKCLEGIVTDTTRERYGAYYTSARTMWFTNNCDSE